MTVYDFTVVDNQGKAKPMSDFQGKVLLVVNTASKCGFTKQLKPMQALYESYEDQGLVVIAFPSNQFASQEPENDAQIKEYYSKEFSVTFPIMAKSDVNGRQAIPIYKWLRKQKSGLFSRRIKWNFTKFLITRDGKVAARYPSAMDPVDLKQDIEKYLAQ